MIEEGSFKYPKNKFQTVDPYNLATINMAGNQVGPLLGQRIMEALNKTREAYPGTLEVPVSEFTQAGGRGLEAALAGLTDLRETGRPTDTKGIYESAKREATRGLTEYAVPSIKESFGVRGGRYGNEIANAISRTTGDIFAKLGTEQARADVGAQEAAQGRRISAASTAGGLSTGLGNIGQIIQALKESNIARPYQEFLRMSQAPGSEYFNAAQNFTNTRPVFPGIVPGPSPAFQPGTSWMEVVNALISVAGIAAAACWIAGALYGWYTREFKLARKFIFEIWQGEQADEFRYWYLENGKQAAQNILNDAKWRDFFKPIFDEFVARAEKFEEIHA